MKCPNCQRENEPTNRFCIFCGSILPVTDAEQISEPAGADIDSLTQQVQIIRQEISRLSAVVNLMNDRLAELERLRGISEIALEPTLVPAAKPPAVSPPAAPEQVRVAVTAEEAPPRKAKPARVKEREWEQILGGHWLARIGALAIVIGIGFFLKFAFDNNWIGPTGRIILGIVAGLAMLGGGYYWRKRYPILAQAISGGGIAVLYLSIFAAFAFYNLIHFYLAIGFLLLVSITSVALALRYNSMALAIIGILGAFIAPFVLGYFGRSEPLAGETGQGIQLLVYIIVIDIGVLALSTLRNWRWFTLLALLCSLGAFGAWHQRFGGEASLLTSMGCLTIIFLIFMGATTLFHIVWRRPARPFDQAIIVINAVSYFGISYGLLWGDFRVWLGGFSLLLALFYGGLAYVVLRRGTENIGLGFFALGIALVFLTVAIPVQLGDRAWTTVAWAAEGVVLMWLSFTLKMPQLRWYSYAAFFITAVRLLFFDHTVDMRTFRPVLNERFLAFLISVIALYIAGYILRQRREALPDWERRAWSVYPIFFVAANFFTIWLLSAEVINYFDTSLALTILWAVYAVILLIVGIFKQWRPVRLWALALLAVPIVKLFAYDVFTLKLLYRIIAFIVLGVLLLVSAYLYQRYSKSIRGFIAKK
jgi:uncharacterized membrane protein